MNKMVNPLDEIRKNPRPVIVDLWAPWCTPCKAMAPAFERVGKQYQGQVDVVKINADDHPEVLQELRVMGIPTMVGFRDGKEVARRVGMQPEPQIAAFFESVLTGEPAVMGMSAFTRLLRLLAGLALAAIGWFSAQSWFLLVLGGVVMFSAVYDRCPVYKAVSGRIKEMLKG
ncbi:MAG: thioredoxin [Chloroflexi bacterium]|nr:thioredoxin [Chloroflexota bacterium]